MNLLDVIRILKGLSKEDRGRCMRSAEIDEGFLLCLVEIQVELLKV